MRKMRYPEYKLSEFEWLGEIPKHWDIIRLKFLVSEPLKYGANEAAIEDDSKLPRYIRITDIDEKGMLKDDTFKSLPIEVAFPYLLEEGDILLARSGATVGKSFHYDITWGEAAFAGYLIRVRLSHNLMLSRFFSYFTNSNEYWQWLQSSLIQATIQNVSAERYANITVPKPTINEQEKIVAILDQKTTRIDSLINKKQKQIALLQEKRTSLISHAVTKGLDPNVPMKDSGVEWLREIPEDWNVIKIKYLSKKIGSGKTPRGGADVYADSGVMLLRSQNIYSTGLELDDVVFIDQETDASMSSTRVQNGDVLLNITGASLGRSCLFSNVFSPANVNQHVCIIRPYQKLVLPEFLSYSICSSAIQFQIFSHENGTSREGLNFNEVGNLLLVLPQTIQEQKSIITILQNKIAIFDSLIDEIEKSIELMKEYRSTLISAAVTGKIDVREEVS